MDLLYENIFANYIYDEGIVSKYVKNSYKQIRRRPTTQSEVGTEETVISSEEMKLFLIVF